MPAESSVGFLMQRFYSLNLNCVLYVLHLFSFQILFPMSGSGYVFCDDRGCLSFNVFEVALAVVVIDILYY
jgi:hypothetical protein